MDPKVPAAHQLLTTLAASGFVVHLADERRYGLGVAAYELGTGYIRQAPLQRLARVPLAALVDRTGHTAHLAGMHGREVIHVIEERGPARPPLVTDVGVRLPAHLTASGRAMLAALPRPQVRALFPDADAFVAGHGAGPRSYSALRRLLVDSRRRGHAVEDGEVMPVSPPSPSPCSTTPPTRSPASRSPIRGRRPPRRCARSSEEQVAVARAASGNGRQVCGRPPRVGTEDEHDEGHCGTAGAIVSGQGYPGGLLARAEGRFGRVGGGLYAFLLGAAAVAVAGAVALLVGQPYLFPSLGPTVMLFFESPMQKASAPRNALLGHGVAILAGALCLVVFGLADDPPVLQEGVTGARIGAAALSVALTALVLKLLAAPHPPAGATTLIVSLGLLTSATELLAIAVGVVLVTGVGLALNRSLGVRQPFWS